MIANRLSPIAAVLCAAAATMPALSAQTFTKTLTFSRFADFPNIKEVTLTYDASLGTTTLTTPAWIAHTPGADGILFAPDGDLIVGGQGNAVYKVDYPNFTYTGVTAGGVNSFHVMLDPRGDKIWTAGNLGELASVPLSPFANGTARPLTGYIPAGCTPMKPRAVSSSRAARRGTPRASRRATATSAASTSRPV